jgi:hypothetical protein
MDERKDLPETEKEEQKTMWQQTKESWYDKVPLSLKQLDILVAVCWVALGLTAVAIALDALDIWHLFG